MVVLSLFDGIACGMQALKDLGIKVDKYYASEIDKYAIDVAMKNHPEIIQVGDITKWNMWNINWAEVDLIIGGSPCQGFTFAGKRLNFEDERSRLFFTYCTILNFVKAKNPNVKFMLENVKMQESHKVIIDQFMGLKGQRINSNLFSAQNRDRIYWTNIEIGDLPEGCDTQLSDILIKDEDENAKLYVSNQHLNGFRRNYNWSDCPVSGKAKPLLATYYKQPPHCPYVRYRADRPDEANEKYSPFRRLSPVECERLQTLPDNYTLVINEKGKENSWTQRYKMIGNGWTLETIKHIFKSLK